MLDTYNSETLAVEDKEDLEEVDFKGFTNFKGFSN